MPWFQDSTPTSVKFENCRYFVLIWSPILLWKTFISGNIWIEFEEKFWASNQSFIEKTVQVPRKDKLPKLVIVGQKKELNSKYACAKNSTNLKMLRKCDKFESVYILNMHTTALVIRIWWLFWENLMIFYFQKYKSKSSGWCKLAPIFCDKFKHNHALHWLQVSQYLPILQRKSSTSLAFGNEGRDICFVCLFCILFWVSVSFCLFQECQLI